MADKQHYTAEQVADALRKSFGIKTVAAQLLGCSDDTITNYCKRYKMVDKVCKEARPRIVDIAEHNLIKDLTVKERCPKCNALLKCGNCNAAIQFGKDWATRFVLQTLGKDRGYVERQEVTFSKERWTELQDTIIEALSDFPEAKEHVVNTLKRRLNGDGESRRY